MGFRNLQEKLEKNSSLKGKQGVTGKPNSNLLYGEVFLQSCSSTESPLKIRVPHLFWRSSLDPRIESDLSPIAEISI